MRAIMSPIIATALLVSSAAVAGEVKITVLYNQPKSAEEFDKYYYAQHMPMIYAVKDIKKVEVARTAPSARSPYYVVTELWFESPEALKAVAATPEWKAIVDDVANFAPPGTATIVVSEVEPKR